MGPQTVHKCAADWTPQDLSSLVLNGLVASASDLALWHRQERCIVKERHYDLHTATQTGIPMNHTPSTSRPSRLRRVLRGLLWTVAFLAVMRFVHVLPGSWYTGEREPYLQRATPHAITVRWDSVQPTLGSVHYGLAPDRLEHQVSDRMARRGHSLELNGLEPGQRYYYRVDNDGQLFRGAAKGVGGDHVDRERLRQSVQSLAHTRDEASVNGQGAVEVEHQVPELEPGLPRDVDLDHRHTPLLADA